MTPTVTPELVARAVALHGAGHHAVGECTFCGFSVWYSSLRAAPDGLTIQELVPGDCSRCRYPGAFW